MKSTKLFLSVLSLTFIFAGTAKADHRIHSNHVSSSHFSHHVQGRPVYRHVARHVRRVVRAPVQTNIYVQGYSPFFNEPCDDGFYDPYYSTPGGYRSRVPMGGYYTNPGFSWGVSFGNQGFNGGYINSRW